MYFQYLQNYLKISNYYKQQLEINKSIMKKIVFVQRQESSTYDPVSTFFSKNATKSNSVMKGPPSTQLPQKQSQAKQQSIQRPPSTKIPSSVQIQNKKADQRQKPITNKIGRKGDHLPPKKNDLGVNKKQQSVYGIGPGQVSKKNIANTKNNDAVQLSETLQKKIQRVNNQQWAEQKQQFVLPNVNERKSPNKTNNNEYGQNRQPNILQRMNAKSSANQNTTKNHEQNLQRQQHPPGNQLQYLRSRVKQLQQQQNRNQEQIFELEQKYQKLEQKFNKVSKQHKQCSSASNENNKRIKQKQEEMKKLLSKQQIPFSKKREILLQNQINNLKKINRQLVTRIKSYKSTDLVELSVMANKTDVLFKQYDHSAHDQDEEQKANPSTNSNIPKIQSLTNVIINQLQSYLSKKASSKQMQFTEQKRIISQIINQLKNLSLQCMSFNQQFKIPASNKEAINIYNEIEKYKSGMDPLIDKYDLNFIITEGNIQLINNIGENMCYKYEFKQDFIRKWTQQPKKFKKVAQASSYYLAKYKKQCLIEQQTTNFSYILLAHCIFQIGFIQSWFSKASMALRQAFNNLNIRLKQIQQLVDLGESGKQSLCLYLRSNIQEMLLKVPDLQIRVKQIGSIFKNSKFGQKNKSK